MSNLSPEQLQRLALHWRALAGKSRDQAERARAKEQAYLLAAEQLEALIDREGRA